LTDQDDAAEYDKLAELSAKVVTLRKALREAEAEYGELYQARRERHAAISKGEG